MTPDENALLTRFLDELSSARAGTRDADADAMIARALSTNPDAAYLLVQHAIVADQSLHAAQQRIADLERQQQQQQQQQPAPASTNFLPSSGAGPWGGRPADPYMPPPPQERPGIFSGGGGLGSFLRNAGTTAAGVAGGEMLFSGLSDLFGHRGGGGMFGGGQGFMDEPQNVTINNYGDDGNDGGGYDDDGSSSNDY